MGKDTLITIRRAATLSSPRMHVVVSLGTLTVDSDFNRLRTEEVDQITEDYLQRYLSESNGVVPVDAKTVRNVLIDSIKNGHVVGIVRQDGIAVGGIIAVVSRHCVSEHPMLQMLMYNSRLKGISAAKAVIVAHRYLIAQAKLRKIKYVMTSCGYWDVNFKLNKILATDGWASEGYISTYTVGE